MVDLNVVYPNGNETLQRGNTYTIRWTNTVASTGGNVKIELLKAGKVVGTIATSTPNDGSQNWTASATGVVGNDFKIRITKIGTNYSDTSDAGFTLIAASPISVPCGKYIKNIRIVDKTISFYIDLQTGNQWKVQLKNSTGSVESQLINISKGDYRFTAKNYGSYTLALYCLSSITTACESCTINVPVPCIIKSAVFMKYGTTTNNGTIINNCNVVQSDSVGINVNVNISPNIVGQRVYLYIYVQKPNGSIEGVYFTYVPPSAGDKVIVTKNFFTAWGNVTGKYVMKSISVKNSTQDITWCTKTIAEISNPCTYINVAKATYSFVVTSPNGGEKWQRGNTYAVKWSSSGSAAGGNVNIDLYKGTSFSGVIAANVSNNGSYNWTIPSTKAISADYRIKISKVGTNYSDISNGYFSIIVPTQDPSPIDDPIPIQDPSPSNDPTPTPSPTQTPYAPTPSDKIFGIPSSEFVMGTLAVLLLFTVMRR